MFKKFYCVYMDVLLAKNISVENNLVSGSKGQIFGFVKGEINDDDDNIFLLIISWSISSVLTMQPHFSLVSLELYPLVM